MSWMCTLSRRQFFPETIEIEEREKAATFLTSLALVNANRPATWYAEEMTDQIDVYRNRELVAVYMAM